MKTALKFTLFAVLAASLAFSDPIVTTAYRYLSDGTGNVSGSTKPSTSPVGIPLMVNGKAIKGVVVTIADYRDGGADDHQQVGNGRLIALIAKPEVRDTLDAGTQWSRYPAWDIEVDGGNPFIPAYGGAVTYSLQLTNLAAGLGGSNAKLNFTSQNVIAADGGALPHQVFIEGFY